MIGAKVGHLTIKDKLGEGGMGAVYRAEHDVMRKPYAVKVLLPQWSRDPMLVQRFTNEAIAVASIKHRNVVDVTDCGQLADGSSYIVMEYLEGGTLARFCASQGGPLSMHEALEILVQIANGLEHAHTRNIVHRDLKPENVLLVQDGNQRRVKILDWGICKLGEHEGGVVTRSGMMAGTPLYMAPEQMRDLRLVDRRSDVYALGVIAYQMITGGWHPYQRMEAPDELSELTAAAIYHLQMTEAPVDPRRRCPGVVDRWASGILAAIHVDPARRPQTARALALMLAEATPGDAYLPSGIDTVRAYANELLEIGNLLETVRAPKPTGKDTRGAGSRYQLGDRLGEGGMAEVFRATRIGAEGVARPVAIKRVLPGFSAVPQFASMFVQEAKLASLLSHPNVVSVLDFDRDDEGRLFLVMEYVEGRDLASLAETGQLPFSTTIFIISGVLRGLGYAHDLPTADGPRGLVHRDVSPQNVLLSWEGAVKVSDFGIAKAREASAATASTLVKGKPQYMSPEQANGEELDGGSDLFAVGIMAWELLTGGQRLFDGTARETIAQVLFRPIRRPRTVDPAIPPDLEAVVMRLLERDRATRYANAEAAIEDLARCADAPRNGHGELARLLAERFPQAIAERTSRAKLEPDANANARPDPDGRVTVRGRPAGVPVEPPRRASPARRARPRPWIAAGAIVVVVAVLVVTVGIRMQDKDVPAASSPNAVRAADEPPAALMLTVTTDPPGGAIRLDGVDRGRAPMTFPVARGQRVTVEAMRDGFEPASRVITVDRETLAVTLTLRPIAVTAPADAGIAASPPDAPAAGRPAPTSSPSQEPRRPVKPPVDNHKPRPGSGFDPNDIISD